MKRSPLRLRIVIGAAVVVLAVAVVAAWILIEPDSMDFAGGKPVSLVNYVAANPTGVPPELRSVDLVSRGRYLAKAADCEVCHTAVGGPLYGGGRAFKTPFGTLYSPNITADPDTGIGGWSDQDFLRAVHKGIARDGSRLYPAFPYASYTYLVDDDVLAIKAYLFSLPTVKSVTPPNDLGFPFNQRPLMAFWSVLYSPDRRFEPLADRSPEWNRGAYLVEALAHCGDCHTPRNAAQGLDNRRKFAGTVVEGWRAYNITADRTSGIGAWTDAELAQYLSAGHAANRGSAGGPMAEAVDASLSALTHDDIAAVVTYLRTVPAIGTSGEPPVKAEPAPSEPKQGLAATYDPRGKQIFEGACASCHAWSGVSPLTPYATLTGDRAVNDPTAINVAQIVISGAQRSTTNGTPLMPAFGAAYSDTEIAAVANYITARFGAKPSSITSTEVAALRP
jgi:mono/diheme cytochrome c family protein